jgi:hypothetical protein
MTSHPNPHSTMLTHYMNPNLAQQSRVWIGLLLLTETIHLLPTTDANNYAFNSLHQASHPHTLIQWHHQTTYTPGLQKHPSFTKKQTRQTLLSQLPNIKLSPTSLSELIPTNLPKRCPQHLHNQS